MSLRLWFRAGAIAIVSLALSASLAAAQDHDRHDRDDDHDRFQDRDRGRDHDRDEHGRGHAYGHEKREHERYMDHDRDLRGWYHDHYRHLPPGLAKRDRLPPGIERRLVVQGYVPVEVRGRMQPCPRELEVMLPPPPPNFVHVVIGGNLVLYNRANFQIADVFHFDIN